MKTIRTRFAPSPTGTLHVGGARTALFNYLFAKAQKGKFLLRIEDTDQKRSTEKSYREMIESLHWLDLEWDEGVEIDGPYGPYRQSERLSIYNQHIDELMEKDLAYPCFCTPEELEAKKEEQISKGLDQIYDGTCRNLTKKERDQKIDSGIPYVIRIKNINQKYEIHDAVQGKVKFDSSIYGDFILRKSDGFPSYNFAVVIDDHLMKISHVIRGVGHLSNTPRQLVIYDAFGWEAPEWAHVSEIVGSDKKKLSKRHGSASVMVFKELGYPVEAFFNYMSLLGWSPGDDREFMDIKTIKELFDIKRCVKSPATFDVFDMKKAKDKDWQNLLLSDFRELLFNKSKLNWLSSLHIREMNEKKYLDYAREWTKDIEFIPNNEKPLSDLLKDRLLKIRNYLQRFDQIEEYLSVFYIPIDTSLFDDDIKEILKGEKVIPLLELLKKNLSEMAPWKPETIKPVISETGNTIGAKGKDLFMPTRIAITGRMHGMEIPVFMSLLGKEASIRNLEKVIEFTKGL